MIPLIIYFIKVNVALMVLYLFYKLLFERDTFFGLRRFILLLIYITAFAYPFVDYTGWFNGLSNPVAALYNRLLPEVILFPDTVRANMGGNYDWIINSLFSFYWIGVTILIIRTTLEFIKIYKSLKKCHRVSVSGNSVYLLQEASEPYSFFNWIFINPVSFSEKEGNEILIHEQTHARELHSLDIVLAQIVIILCWFNPFAWLLRSEIRINHEYLADKHVISSGYDKKTYQYHLIGLKHSSLAAANLYNNFSVLPLKNRIKMLNKKRTQNILMSKYLMFLPVVALLVFFSNCSGELKQSESSETKISSELADKVNWEAGKDSIYETVDKMPEFPGGIESLMNYMLQNVKYPVSAQEAGIQGRVIIQFVINPNGTVSNVTVVKNIDPSLDEEAVRVVKAMPKWKAGELNGKAVPVKFTIPVSFQMK